MRRSFASKQSSFAYAPTSEKTGMSLKIKQSKDLQQNNHKENNKEHALQNFDAPLVSVNFSFQVFSKLGASLSYLL